jgi:DNA-binding transcriptional LysR family regulator
MLGAAKTLGVNQSTVQRRLAELEKSLGCRLIIRHLTGYRLTELSECSVHSAESVEQAVAAFERDLAARNQALSGTVRMTTGSVLADRMRRSTLLDAFHARYPNVRLELVTSDRFLDLSKGEADIAIRAGEPHDETLVGRKIADYPAARWLRSVAPHATVAACCDSWSGLVLAVKSGAGLAPLLAYQGDSELICVLDKIDLVTPLYPLMHRDMPRVRAFADFVAAEINGFRRLVSG